MKIYYNDFVDLHYILNYYDQEFTPHTIPDYGIDIYSYYFDFISCEVFINCPYVYYEPAGEYQAEMSNTIKYNKLLYFIEEFCE